MELQAMIIAIYARVSTSDQSCEMQLYELRQYVQKRGWQVFAEYVDTGFSGASSSRPRLDQLLRGRPPPQVRSRPGLEIRPLGPQCGPLCPLDPRAGYPGHSVPKPHGINRHGG